MYQKLIHKLLDITNRVITACELIAARNGFEVPVHQQPGKATLGMVITRRGGKIEDLGIVSEGQTKVTTGLERQNP